MSRPDLQPDLQLDLPVDLPVCVGIRALTPADAEAGAVLARSRGWAFEPDRWRFMLAVGDGWAATAAAGELLGTVQLTPCTADVVVVGSMLVAARAERRGLGWALLGRALDDAGDRVVTLFATRPGRPLYERAGFRAVGGCTMFRGTFGGPTGPAGPAEPTGPTGATGPGRTRPASAGDLPAIAALDARAHGGDRTSLLAPLLDLATATAVLTDEDGGVRAFGAAWPSDGCRIVGPLIAVDGASAVAVLDALAAELPGPARVDVHDGRPEVTGWLAARGLTAFARTTVMVRGDRALPGDRSLVHAPIMQSLT